MKELSVSFSFVSALSESLLSDWLSLESTEVDVIDDVMEAASSSMAKRSRPES